MRIILFAFFWFVAPVPAWAAPMVLVYGDSLSAAYGIPRDAGWVALLERRLAEQVPPWRTVNASVSGETSAGGLARLPAVLDRHRPDIVVLVLGANDGLRGLAADRLRDNLIAMVGEARRRGARVLLVGMRLPPNYGSSYASEFQAAFATAAKRSRTPLVPFLLADIATHSEWFLPDGLHPVAQAQPYLLEQVWRGLMPMLRSLR